jgi:DNA-binding protein WhiA
VTATFTAITAACGILGVINRQPPILGDAAPEHVARLGRLRLHHRQVSLETLGQRADPALSKDAVADRIRRLSALADRHARARGPPDAATGLPAQLGTGT